MDAEHLAPYPGGSVHQPPQWIPLHPDFSNYSAVFHEIPIERFFLNSVIVTVLIVAGQTITCTLSGYAFAMIEFPAATPSSWSSSPP